MLSEGAGKDDSHRVTERPALLMSRLDKDSNDVLLDCLLG